MRDPVTGKWIVFNGEIYNYRELRKELGVRGEARERDSEEKRAKGKEQQRTDRKSVV